MRKIWIASLGAVVLVAVGLHGWELYQIHTLASALNDARWDRASDAISKEDAITANVGSIQFIKGNAFSVELEKVDYTANGLHLAGYLGNATNLYLSNLTLTFTATKQVYDMRADFDKADEKTKALFDWLGTPSIGNAQSSAIAALAPGTKQPFDVTIPNVKQTTSGVRITVEFSGERYSYGL